MTYSKTINGITITAGPAIAQTLGPSGALIEFTSDSGTWRNTGASLPIRIQFSTPIKTFGVTVVGQTNANHRLEAYDMGGRLIGQVFGTPTIPDKGNGGSDVILSISGNPAAWIAWVNLVPPAADYVGYKNIVIVPRDTVPNEPPATDVDLATLIIVDISTINRTYELGSMAAVPSQVVNIRNTSTSTPIQVDLTETPDIIGMSFSPEHFPLAPSTTQAVTITFDPVALNTNPVAELLSKIVIDLSVAGAPPPPPPPEPPTQLSWYEERFGDSPLRYAFRGNPPVFRRPTDAELFSNPTSVGTIATINYFNSLTAPMTVRWTQVITVTQTSDYTFTMVTDDGMRFYINNVLTMNEWRDQDDLTRSTTVRLQPGIHTFKVEYFNNGAGSTARFGYTSEVVVNAPTSLQETNWIEERFKGSPDQLIRVRNLVFRRPTYDELFSNPTSVQPVANINYFNSLTAPITVRWIKTVTLTEIYEFAFRLVTDDGMRFYINDTLTMNEWRQQDDKTATKNVILTPGTYTFRVEYYNHEAGSTARFSYTPTLILQ